MSTRWLQHLKTKRCLHGKHGTGGRGGGEPPHPLSLADLYIGDCTNLALLLRCYCVIERWIIPFIFVLDNLSPT